MGVAGVDAALHTLSSYDVSGVDAQSTAYAVGVKMLDKTMEQDQIMSLKLLQTMEQSVTPGLGTNIDIFV